MPNNLSTPLISVVIPVRNCETTIDSTIRSVLNQNTKNFEVVIADNLCTDNTAKVVQSIKDNRIEYFKAEEHLSMCGSYEFAVSKAVGEFIIIIGGDDGLHPNSLDRLEKEIVSSDYKMFCWDNRIYKWPNSEGKSYEDLGRFGRFKDIEVFDAVSRARDNMKLGGWRYDNLVSVYHAATSRKVLELIKKEHNLLFFTTQPDVYTSYVLPAYIKYIKVIKEPISISGHSKHGNSAVMLDKTNKNYDKFMAEYGDYKLDKSVPKGIPVKEGTLFEPLYVAKNKFKIYDGVEVNRTLSWVNVVYNTRFNTTIFKNWKICAKNNSIIEFMKINFYLIVIFFYKQIRDLSGKGPNSSLLEVKEKNIFDYSIESEKRIKRH